MNEEIKSPQTIIGWVAENIKRIKLVQLKPDGKTILITGANAQGKTSLADSYWWAIGGKNAMRKTSEPIREGEAKARAFIEFQDFTVERVITRKDSYLYVTLKDGTKITGGPQEFLDLYRGSTSIDPTEILRLSPKEQVDMLLKLFGIYDEVAALDDKYAKIYQLRWAKGQERDSAIGALENLPKPDEKLPQQEVSITDISNELVNANNHNKKIGEVKIEIQTQINYIEGYRSAQNTHKESIERYKAEIEKCNVATSELEQKIVDGNNAKISKEKQLADLRPIETVPIQERLNKAEGLNTQIREAKRYSEFASKVETIQTEHKGLNQECEAILKQKQDKLNSIKMPVDGLSIDDRGLLFGPTKRPLAQLSNAEQHMIAGRIAMSEKPNIRVLRITHGESLDDETFNMYQKMADEYGYQLIVEKVDTSGKLGIVLEEGEVIAQNKALTHTEIKEDKVERQSNDN